MHRNGGSSAVPRVRGRGPEWRDSLQQLREGSAGPPTTEVDTSYQQRSNGEAVRPVMQVVIIFMTARRCSFLWPRPSSEGPPWHGRTYISNSFGFIFFSSCRATAVTPSSFFFSNYNTALT